MIVELKDVPVESVTAGPVRGVPWMFLMLRADIHTLTRELLFNLHNRVLKRLPVF